MKKEEIVICIIIVTELIGFGLILPVISLIGKTYNIDNTKLGILLASYGIVQFFSAPLLGSLSDRFGRKKVLMFSQMGTAISHLIFAFSHSYHLFLLARLVDGISAGNTTVARAYIADITSSEDRHKGMAIIGIGLAIGMIIGPIIGGLLASEELQILTRKFGPAFQSEHTIPFIFASFATFLAIIQTFFFLKEPKHKNAEISSSLNIYSWFLIFKKIITNISLLKILLAQFVFMIVYTAFESPFALFVTEKFHLTTKDIGFTFAYLGLIFVFVQGFIVRKIQADARKMSIFGFIITSIGMILCAYSPYINIYALYLSLAIVACGIGIITPFLPTLISLSDKKDPEGEIMGIFEGFGSIGRVVGQIGGFMLLSYVSPVVFYALLGVTAGFCCLFIIKK